MAILVTGGAGFIGSHLLDYLSRTTDEKLICIDDFNDYYPPERKRNNIAQLLSNGRLTVAEGDICDEPFCEAIFQEHRIEKVVHMAARAGIRASVDDPMLYQRTNSHGTLLMLELARRHGVKHFVFASSSSVYGDRDKAPFREEDIDHVPANPYGVTKRAGEMFCHVYHQLYGLSVVCLRFFSVYGPRNRPDMALHVFADAIREGKELPLFGDGSARRDFTYCDDVITAVSAALDLKPGFAIINIGNNRPIEVRELIAELEKGLGKQAKVKHLPPQRGDVKMTCADISRAQQLLDYKPSVTLSEGVPRFIEWYGSR